MAKTLADKFIGSCELLYDFDPGASEDQDGEIHTMTFSDGSKLVEDWSDLGDDPLGDWHGRNE